MLDNPEYNKHFVRKKQLLEAKSNMEQSLLDATKQLEDFVEERVKFLSERLLTALEVEVKAYKQLAEEFGESPELAEFQREKYTLALNLLHASKGNQFDHYLLLKQLMLTSFQSSSEITTEQGFPIKSELEPTTTESPPLSKVAPELEYSFQQELERLVTIVLIDSSNNVEASTQAANTLVKLANNSPTIFDWLLNYQPTKNRRKLLLTLATGLSLVNQADALLPQRHHLIDVLMEIADSDVDSLERLTAVYALSNLEAVEAIPTLIAVLMTDSDSDVRRHAALALGTVGKNNPHSATTPLLIIASDFGLDLQLRLAALHALNQIGTEKELVLLQKLLQQTKIISADYQKAIQDTIEHILYRLSSHKFN